MTKIYSYVLRVDDGAAPNPFWGICTLVICKPRIRKSAEVGDWIVGTGSKRVKLADGKICDFSNKIVYAMKVTEKMTLCEYDGFCRKNLNKKIPDWENDDWRFRVGDCIYDYSKGNNPILRKGVHKKEHIDKDLSGIYALLSEHFYYFGEKAVKIPTGLREIIKKNQGHKCIRESNLIQKFEKWISRFEKNKIYGWPQMKWLFEKEFFDCSSECLEGENCECEKSLC